MENIVFEEYAYYNNHNGRDTVRVSTLAPTTVTATSGTWGIGDVPFAMGWVCPLCRRVNGPSVEQCPCSDPQKVVTGTTAGPSVRPFVVEPIAISESTAHDSENNENNENNEEE